MQNMRKVYNFNENWLFHKGDLPVPRPVDKGPVYTQAKIERKLIGPAAYNYFDKPDSFYQPNREMKNDRWEYVTLPHDYIIDQDNDKLQNNAHGYFKYENAWYRKHFTLQDDVRGKRVTLQFGGIAGQSTVYLNGCLMKHNFSTYNSFEVDISNNIYYDRENVLAVYSNVEEFEGWWYQGGGIYRNVKLVITDPISIDLYGVYAPYEKLNDTDWAVNFETTVRNDSYEDAAVVVTSVLCDKNGNAVASASAEGCVSLREKATLHYSTVVHDPLVWDIDDPNLYTVKTTLTMNGEELDENNTRIGFRTFHADPDKGFFLNGRHVKIKGVCGHQDFGLTGLAIPDNIAKYKIKLIKEMGANGYRTSHYQQNEATLDALDEYGFIVMDEARWFETTDEAIEQLETLVKRDRNRPSVVFWSTGNEERVFINDVGQRVHRALYQVIRKLDKTRFITAAEDCAPLESMVFEDCDVIGINYNLPVFDEIHKKYPHKPIVSSECCATGTSREWHFPDTFGRASAWDKDTNAYFLSKEKTWKYFAEREYIMGMYQWVAVDHRGEAVWPMLSSKSGSFDMFLQKKSVFYLNKSLWSDEPVAHIVPHWNFKGLEGEEIKVTVYTNGDLLELFLNDESLGKKEIEKYGHGEWLVPYTPGTLRVKAYRGGVLIAEDERKTTGAPAKLRLNLVAPCGTNGSECALFVCDVLDENGLAVPTASEYVKFFATDGAQVIGTGSDSCDHSNVTNPERKMYMGKITVAVRPQAGSKGFTLYAQSDALGLCKLNVTL